MPSALSEIVCCFPFAFLYAVVKEQSEREGTLPRPTHRPLTLRAFRRDLRQSFCRKTVSSVKRKERVVLDTIRNVFRQLTGFQGAVAHGAGG